MKRKVNLLDPDNLDLEIEISGFPELIIYHGSLYIVVNEEFTLYKRPSIVVV